MIRNSQIRKQENIGWSIQDYDPDPLLAPFIYRLYILKGKPDPSIQHEIWIPSGTVEVVFDLEAPFEQATVGQILETRPSAFVTGLFEKCLLLRPTGSVYQVGVVFKTGKFRHFSGVSNGDIKGSIISIEDIFGASGLEVQDQLARTSSDQEKIDHLQSFLQERLNDAEFLDNPFISYCIDTIKQHHGFLPIASLSKKSHISDRHFRRIFKEYTGITPKKYARFIRLLSLIKDKRRADTRPSVLAEDLGFYDASHVYHEFKKVTGMIPQQYIESKQPLADLFFQ